MGNNGIYIVKRDGKRVPFSIQKIENAIAKAFLSVGAYATQDDLIPILARLHISDGMTVEEIQNQVEVALMAEKYFAVAKSYMLYRQKHAETREIRDKMTFLMNYCDAQNAATGSKFDANANVEKKNIATLIGELPKKNFINLNRKMLTGLKMYGKELADKYIGMLNEHFIYKNDETSLANCHASITMYRAAERYHTHRRELNAAHQPEIVLRRVREYGLHRVEHAERRLRHARVPDVHGLLYPTRIWR